MKILRTKKFSEFSAIRPVSVASNDGRITMTVQRRAETDEYRVAPYNTVTRRTNENAAYYTNSLDDALCTMLLMMQQYEETGF